MRVLIPFLIIFLSLSSCNESDEPSLDSDTYLIFGRFAGFCVGENCIQIFKLDSNSLSKDVLRNYPDRTNFYAGEFIPMDESKFELAAELLERFPMELLNETDTVFGCPDCTDQGGFYLEIKNSQTHRFWILDGFTTANPEYLKDYVSKLYEIIPKL